METHQRHPLHRTIPPGGGAVRAGECDLTVISIIGGVLTKENCAEVVSWLRGRSLREVEAFAARRQPGKPVRDQVRQIYVMSVKPDTKTDGDPASSNESPTPAEAPRNGTEPTAADTTNTDPDKVAELHRCSVSTPSAGSKTVLLTDNKQFKNCDVRRNSGGDSSDAPAFVEEEPAERIVVEPKYKIQFAVDPAFMEKLNKIKSFLSTKYPKKIDFETIFDILMSEYLDRHGPEERINPAGIQTPPERT